VVLHLRVRLGAPAVAMGLIGLVCWLTARWQLSRPLADETSLVALYTLGCAAAGLTVGFAFADPLEATERATARSRLLVRLAPVLAAAVVVAVALAPIALLGGTVYGVGTVARNAVGMAGLALVGAAVAGRAGASVAVLSATALMLTFGRDESSTIRPWAWSLAPASSTTAVAWACSLGVLGLIALALPPWRPDTWQPTPRDFLSAAAVLDSADEHGVLLHRRAKLSDRVIRGVVTSRSTSARR